MRYINKGEDLRIMVLVDRDDDDCVQLEAKLEQAAAAGCDAVRERVATGGARAEERG
ncbi:MAG: hypothetical protein ACFCVA_16620 [Gammaproteobacteria bacterium]